jgi:hypothetical protein
MKKITLLLALSILLISCGKSKEEQMIYDFQNNISLKKISVDLKDTDFKIISIEKVKNIIANDSLKIKKKYLKKETIKVIASVESNIEFYKSVGENTDKFNESLKQYKNNNYKNTYLESTFNLIQEYKKDTLKILSIKYKVTYSMTNPILKAKQTFTKNYYTNTTFDKFVKSEEVKK